jgi:glycosyltransferase involved in cell wall biosynthesis/predicted RNA methylase
LTSCHILQGKIRKLAFASKSAEAQSFAEIDKILELNPNAVPASFSHYVWASEFCKEKRVLDLGCGAGFGTMILSSTASKCTGLDINREAIKYALRNCYVEGKTKFSVLADTDSNYGYDVILSLNTDSESAQKLINQMTPASHSSLVQPQIITVLFGVTANRTDSALAVKELTSIIPHSVQSTFYLQDAREPHAISEFKIDGQTKDAIRIIAAIEVRSDLPHSEEKSRRQRDLVSIVIPTYNRDEFISEAINSALNQTYTNVEVIVVDDGSKDSTREIVAKYGNRVRYYYKENGGIGSALNLGIRKMNGKWFKWLSSDDVLTPDAVEVLVSHADATGALITYTDYDIIDYNGNHLKKFVEPHFTSYFEYASALWTRFIGNGSSVLVAKSCFDEVGLFDENLRSAEDYEWWLRACLLHGHRFFHIPAITLKYRTHGNQLTAAVKHNAYVTAEKIRNKIKQKIISEDPKWWQALESYQKLYAKQNQKGGFARRLLRKSLLHMPEAMRKNAMKSWQHSFKPRIDSEESHPGEK